MAAAATGSSDVQGKKARERVMIVQHRRSMEAVTGFLLAAAIAIGLTLPDQAWGQASVTVEAAESRHAGEFMVPVDKSQVLRLDEIGRANVQNPVTNAHLVCRLLLEK